MRGNMQRGSEANGSKAGQRSGPGVSKTSKPPRAKARKTRADDGAAGNGKGNGKRERRPEGEAAPRVSAAPGAGKLRRRLPVIDDEPGPRGKPLRARPRRVASPGGIGMQLQVAGFLRVVDRVVSALVNTYDSVFVVDSKDQADIFLEAGLRFAAEGRITEAIEALRKTAHLLPDDPLPLVELGALHMRRQAPTAAIQVLEQARELGSREARMHALLADAYLAEDRVAEAVVELETAFATHVDDPELAYRLGLALDRHGNHAEAAEAFALAVELDPDEVRFHQSLGFALESLGQREDAVRCFKRALELEHREDMDAAE